MEEKPKNKRPIILFAVLLVLMIASVFVTGLIKFRSAQTLKEHCTATAYGTVTRVDRTQSHRSVVSGWRNVYYIEADFYLNDVRYTASAEERRGKNDYGQNARFKTETTITIMYNPGDPGENYIKAAIMDEGKMEMLSVVLVPAVFLFMAIRYKKEQDA